MDTVLPYQMIRNTHRNRRLQKEGETGRTLSGSYHDPRPLMASKSWSHHKVSDPRWNNYESMSAKPSEQINTDLCPVHVNLTNRGPASSIAKPKQIINKRFHWSKSRIRLSSSKMNGSYRKRKVFKGKVGFLSENRPVPQCLLFLGVTSRLVCQTSGNP